PTRTVLVVMVGVCSMAALVWAAASGFVDPYVALVFCLFIALGELARITLPGQREVAPVASAGAISYAFLLSLGDGPVEHSAVQVVAVAALGVALGELPHVAVGRAPGWRTWPVGCSRSFWPQAPFGRWPRSCP